MTQPDEVNVSAKKKTTKPETKPAAEFRRLPPADPYEMTDEEIRLQMARDNLAKYGSTIAPAAPAKAPKTGPRTKKPPAPETEERLFAAPKKPRPVDVKWFATPKRCPHCGKTKYVMPDFGVVLRRGIEQAAGWCRQCRSETDYRQRPRVYKVKG